MTGVPGIRVLAAVLVFAMVLCAQSSPPTDLINRTEELERLIVAGDWERASGLSRTLKAAVAEARDQTLAEGGSQLTDSILNWLPPDTASLVVSRQPFAVPGDDRPNAPSALEVARGYVLSLLAVAEKGEMAKTLRGRTVRLAVLGARRFGEDNAPREPGRPTPLGMIAYQGCAYYAFASPLPDSFIARAADDVIAGHRAWVSKGTQNDTPNRDTYIVSVLEPDLVTVCNSREYFQEMALRIGIPQQVRALPTGLPEWKQVDKTAPLWGISLNPPRMLTGTARDSPATGVTVEFGLASGVTRSRMMAKSNPWAGFYKNPAFHGSAQSREVSPGVWELSVSNNAEAGGMAAFVLMGTLGFIVLI